jgi:ATP-dependent DNA ligase
MGSDGRDSFDALWNRTNDDLARLCAFDLLELDDEDFRSKPSASARRGWLNF